MKLAVFGGTGKTGRQLVEQALCRRPRGDSAGPDAIEAQINDERLHVVQGDALDSKAVEKVVPARTP